MEEQRSGDLGLIIAPDFILDITLRVTGAALLGAAAWSARAARRWWRRHHRKMSFPQPLKLARIRGPPGRGAQGSRDPE